MPIANLKFYKPFNSKSILTTFELCQIIACLPHDTKIIEFVEPRTHLDGEVSGLVLEHPSFEDEELQVDYIRRAYVEDGHLKVINEFKGISKVPV